MWQYRQLLIQAVKQTISAPNKAFLYRFSAHFDGLHGIFDCNIQRLHISVIFLFRED